MPLAKDVASGSASKGLRQVRLQDCKAVCRSRRPFFHANSKDVAKLHTKLKKAIGDADGGKPEYLLKVLGHLSVCTQHFDSAALLQVLKSTGVGRSCGGLRQHGAADVARFARRLVESWRSRLEKGRENAGARSDSGAATRTHAKRSAAAGTSLVVVPSSPSPSSSSSSSPSSPSSSDEASAPATAKDC